ncbi:NAD(P)/FAD-dependent oxidoreductase [Nitriliruptoraceae bacterium ZYF776]|nr:NAD(P)/FAD-dependent oxidoreductase [Profundirhabdus halotolerans]
MTAPAARPASARGFGPRDVEVVVVGAGQAGLSAAYHLARRGVVREDGFVVLDADEAPGGAWQHRWPSLTWERVHGLHPLPASDAPTADPDIPAREVVAPYFAAYEAEHDLPVHRPVAVSRVEEHGDGRLRVVTDAGTWITRVLLNATGTWTKPFVPTIPGQETFAGRQLHTADYPGPVPFADARIVVVGGGSSAVQHLAELSEVAASTTWVTRRPPTWTEGDLDPEIGRRVVAMVAERVEAGLPPRSVVSATGLYLGPHEEAAAARGVYRRLPLFDRVVADGVAWDDPAPGAPAHLDADVILYATGFRHALDHLAPLKLRGPEGGVRMRGTRVAADARVHLLGYGPSASTIGANRAGRDADREVVRFLADAAA